MGNRFVGIIGKRIRVAAHLLVTFGLVALATGCLPGRIVYRTGPYRGTVVDAETKQPLEGVVVLAIWYRETVVVPSGHGPAVEYHGALEVLTGTNGEFIVPEKTHTTLVGSIGEPRLVVYYPGYAFYPSLKGRPQGEEVSAAYEKKIFDVELSRLKTREERLEYVRDMPVWIADVPDARMPILSRLVNQERQELGLKPVLLGR